MSLDTDLRTVIIASSTTLQNRVHQNVVPQQQGKTYPHCWYARAKTDDPVELDGTRSGVMDIEYDAEFISDVPSQAITAAEAVRTAINGLVGSFGSSTIKGCLVTDQNDEYQPRGTGDDTGLHVTALRIRIVST